MTYVAWGFAASGLICAAVPIIIHLLNRRRYRTVQWAAMDFLREALQRNRRIMQLRDLLLLALRVAAVALFGLALAQPYFASKEEEFNREQPLHAVLVVDNSLSMGYEESLDATLLDQAKSRAEEFIKELPSGSRVTVVPLCGSPNSYSLEPYRTVNDSIDALNAIDVVDRGASVAAAANLAKKAVQHSEPQMAKRVVFFGDQQRSNWRGSLEASQLARLPEMQVVDISAENPQNSWVEDFRIDDGIADIETAAHFRVMLRHEGEQPRRDVQVSLWSGEEVVAVKTVNLEPGTTAQEVDFSHTFTDFDIAPGESTWASMKVSISSDENDRLVADNERFLVVPVVSVLPVVFVDELGALGEDPAKNKYGETARLRKFLAPVRSRDDRAPQLVKVDHCTVDQLDEDRLADARMVVIAGVETPADKVELLRQYVTQGGQLLIATGGEFDPQAWTETAWLDGGGILPAPIEAELIGVLPAADSGEFNWFELAYDKIMKGHALFQLSGVADPVLADLYGEAWFYQAVKLGDMDAARDAVKEFELKRLTENQEFLAEAADRESKFSAIDANGGLDAEQRAMLAQDKQRKQEIDPNWLHWSSAASLQSSTDNETSEGNGDNFEDTVRNWLPTVLAQFTNEEAFLVERKIGHGRVVFATSGIAPEWNSLARSNTMLLMDRLARAMLQTTTPPRNFVAQDRLVMPVNSNTSGLVFELQRPASGEEGASIEELSVGYLGANVRGLEITDPLRQGIYTVTAFQETGSSEENRQREKKWQTPLAVNVSNHGASESELAAVTQEEFEEQLAKEDGANVGWVARGEPISLAGTTVRGQNLWLYLIIVVLVLLLVEVAILAWPALTAPPAQAEATT